MPDFLQNLILWLLSYSLKIFFILIGTYSLNHFFQTLIKKIIEKSQMGGKEDRKKRTETLLSVLGGTFRFVIYITAFLMILSVFGINITPILTSLGLAGLAAGMAARDIIADFIAGIFIILENQYQIGDKVKIGGIEGKVKEITLRRTIILDENNISHFIPNSQIKIVSKKAE